MKSIFLPVLAITLTAQASFGGNWLGSGPWANGAYYPGQFDGIYSATMFAGSPSVVSGVMGFGLRNGSASTSSSSTVATDTAETTITVDPLQNYFVTFIDGVTYAGLTVANVNNQVNQVSGGLYSGFSPTYTLATTSTVTTPPVPPAVLPTVTSEVALSLVRDTCSGGFTATLTGKKAIITFSGDNTGTLQTTDYSGSPSAPQNTFSLNGLKVGNQTAETSVTP